jgi:pimeloyl-[acyl-carrier protein] methyl ester esterase
VPVLVLAGRSDRIIRPSASRAMARILPDARYVQIEGAAHAPFLSHPGQCARLLREFLHE